MNKQNSQAKKQKKYSLADLVNRSNEKEIKAIYVRAAKEADKMQAEMLRRAARIK